MTKHKLAITVCSTRDYCYALRAQSVRVAAAVGHEPEGVVIMVGDDSAEFRNGVEDYKTAMPTGWEVLTIQVPSENGLKNYKVPAQLLIARMRSIAFTAARQRRVNQCWSLDSDVLPPANALLCSQQMLEFDSGYYAVAACPYPSQGGTAYLCGRGDHRNPIFQDFLEEEREIPEELKKELEELNVKGKAFHDDKKQPDAAWHKQYAELTEKARHCPPKGNIFEMNAKGWRRRGWFDNAYPAIGIGAVVPSDWCGFGCTLMSERALAVADFSGYDGRGTEDLYINFKRWARVGHRIAAIAHCPCDHVIRDTEAPSGYKLQQAHHEMDGECIGHLRVESREWHPL